MKNPRIPFAYSVYFAVKKIPVFFLFLIFLLPALLLLVVGILAGLMRFHWLNDFCQDGLDDFHNIFARL